MSTVATVGRVSLPLPVMIGAGVCKNPDSTMKWLQIVPTVSGSYTPRFRLGNEGARLSWPDDLETFLREGMMYNWWGMPNMGVIKMLRRFKSLLTPGQPLVISIAAFKVRDYIRAIKLVAAAGIAVAIEINIGCQNTEHGKPLSFDVHGLKRLLQALSDLPNIGIPLWLKVSPYVAETSFLLPEVIKLVNQYRERIAAVVTCNTYWSEAGKDKISSPDGYASLSGPALKDIALEQLDRFRAGLHHTVDVISVGGITTGTDIVNRFARGAAAVQLISLPSLLRPDQFWDHLLADGRLAPYLQNEGYVQ